MKIGDAIVLIRKKKNLKQGELAQLANINQSYLSQLERNNKDPNVKTLQVIADALGVPLPVLFFLSISEEDIPEDKKEPYKSFAPLVKSFIENIFILDAK